MSLPTVTKTWTYLVNQTVTYTSVNQVMGDTLYKTKEFLKTTMGYTVKGSCNATTGAMDGVDRWTNGTDAGHRGANNTSACSWFVFTDGNGIDICLAYIGGSDDLCRLTMSAGGLYVVAGTTTFAPTATDEAYGAGSLAAGASLVASTTSGNRILHFWGSSDKKDFKVMVCSAGAPKSLFGVLTVIPSVASNVTIGGNAVVFMLGGTQLVAGTSTGLFGFYLNSSRQFQARVNIAGVAQNVNCSMGAENFIGNGTMTGLANVFCDLQQDYLIQPLSLGAATAGQAGKLGNLNDWWCSRRTVTDGDVMGTKQFVVVGCCLLPWDGTSTMALT